MQSFLVLLSLTPPQGQLHHTVLAVEEPALLPLTTHLLQLAISHVLHLIDEHILILVTAVAYLHVYKL